MIRIKSKKIITNGSIFDGFVYLKDGKIAEITEKNLPCDEEYDFSESYVSSGFIDIHTHGAGGWAFMNSTPDDVVNGCNYHLKHGTTSIAPTISAGSFETMKKAVINIAEAMKSGKTKSNILGSHLEGPYLSAKQCGAQCPIFITEPIENDYKTLIEEYGDTVLRWTYAPENDKDGEFCKYLTEHGIIASAGHTDAKYADMKIAAENGCSLVTHLYSCTSTVTRDHGFRSLGVIESAFLSDSLYVEIIADGKHLPYELIKMIVKIKGIDKVAAITDSLEIAGTDIKEGVMSGTEFIVEDGVCKLKDRTAFAGSVATADVLLKTLVNGCGFSITDSVRMLSKTPAEIIGANKGDILCGRDGDIVVFDSRLDVTDVFVMGNKIDIKGM